jgi:hypothetical protein
MAVPLASFALPATPTARGGSLWEQIPLHILEPFMLVSALMGIKRMQAAYAHAYAIAQDYRFCSYGDSLLLPCA